MSDCMSGRPLKLPVRDCAAKRDPADGVMHTLPTLQTERGEFQLPLADVTAGRLIDALLTVEQGVRRNRFRTALAGDPVLCVWAICRRELAQRCQTEPHAVAPGTLDQLAQWLAEIPAGELRPTCAGDCQQDTVAEFSESAGCSLVAAELAAHLAEQVGADAEAAYLLGLMHLAAAWLAESAVGSEPPRLTAMLLPAWLNQSVLRLSQPASEQTLELQAVAQAIALVCCDDADAWRAMGCEAAHWIGRWAALGEAWGRPGQNTDRLTELVARLDACEKLQRDFAAALETAKIEAVKEFAYGAGHEINNPLANISARAQTLLASESDAERRRTLAAINAQAFRAHEMIADMMLFARPPQPVRSNCNLHPLLTGLIDELADRAAEQHAELQLDLPAAAIVVSADATQLAVAVRSLLVNALEALVDGGWVRVALEPPAGDPGEVRIVVADNGPGIPAEVRSKIFDPYFSGREAGRGLGLGLSKCWQIVRMHGGRIEVGESAAGGARFAIVLTAG